ncbi:uncharacterized protein CEXT_278261, partial [Caerostris extrusa]
FCTIPAFFDGCYYTMHAATDVSYRIYATTDDATIGCNVIEYLNNIACFKNLVLVSDSRGKCSRDGFTAYQTYQNSVGLFEDENDEVHDSRAWCMGTAYTMACFSADLGESCGEAARTTFVDTLKRFKYLRMTDCTEANIQELKTNFLDSLKLEEDRRNIFYTMFDQRRRK